MSVILRVGAVNSSEGQELQYGSGDEASSSYTDADVLDIPLPEHTYQRPLPPSSSHAHSSTGYFGLPYQDHNYGLPPPHSPPRTVSPRPPSPLQVNGVVQMEEEVKTTPLVSVVEEVVEDSVTRCICGYLHDDGYMICCDKCSVWQHIDCMGVDRNNIPESYFCELCQPRILDAVKAKMLQKRKREELAARNVLSDSSATDTDPEEAANALASMGKKLPGSKKKGLKQKRNTKVKDKPPLKLKIGKALAQKKAKKPGKKEKENIKAAKPKKMFKMRSQKLKSGKSKNRPLLTLDQLGGDPWNSHLSPWVDSYDVAVENQYSPAVQKFLTNSHLVCQSVDISVLSDQLLAQLTCVADVKKNRKGLKATQEISAGQAIIEYRGKVMLRHDYDKEHSFVNSFKKLQPFVLFYSKLDVDLCVDARTFGNEARFVRRSCTPNSEVQHIFSQGKIYFVILSKKNILTGSEITIPFDYNYEECSYCVECACVKNNCIVSRYWKKLKNAQKASTKDFTVKRKRQSSGGDGNQISIDEAFNSSSSQGSPSKSSTSPVKALQMKLSEAASPPPLSSPVKLSNVSTLLAASALLDGQPDLASSLKLEVPDTIPPPPSAPLLPPPKSATSSRRGSRISEDSIKEEKPSVTPHSTTKEKQNKTREPKLKDKEGKDHHYFHTEVKKERRPSSRRQSQEEPEDTVDSKSDASVPTTPSGIESEDSNTGSDCPRKMTREERKLDAIMKAFEKMEKRQERRKEAMARGDCGPKKSQGEAKSSKKKDDTDSNSSCSNVQSRSASQEGPAEEKETIKTEPVNESPQDVKSPTAGGGGSAVPETTVTIFAPSDIDGLNANTNMLPAITSTVVQETPKPLKEEPPQKPIRKTGKRKRRRSRVQSTTALSDAASISTDEGNSNSSFPVGPLSTPSTPAVTPISTPVPVADDSGGMFKYLKTKKHLFEEWSNKQEDENSKHEEEMFVQCLPNPHVNTMDHLQRRNSHSAGCSSRGPGSESSVGSAKKRWLRQAMHEVPAPVTFNHSLSVSTDSGCGSPVHGGASPNPGTCLGSPGAASPLDFVTPLKKRRLMRESLSGESNGPTASAGSDVLTENFTSNSVGISSKTNGVKQFFPAHRHSTDDRLLLHKGYPHQNGFRDVIPRAEDRRSVTGAASHSHLNSTATRRDPNESERRSTVREQRFDPIPATDPLPVTVSYPLVNGMSEAVPINSVSLTRTEFNQPANKIPIKFRGIFERMEVDSSDETLKDREIQSIASSSRMEENSIRMSKPSRCVLEEDNGIDSSASTSAVVVVNSSVYNSVNNLMDEGSEAGCVTTKSIMDIDSPAIVRVDLNAHEMEPSSLSDGTAVVTLDDRLFTRNCRDIRGVEAPSDCQVNSSVDVIEALPLVTEGGNGDICDNVCTDSSSAQIVRGLWDQNRGDAMSEHQVEEEEETVDSSQHVNRDVIGEFAAVFEEEETSAGPSVPDVVGTSPSLKPDTEGISSSGQANSQESVSEEPNALCDSVEESESLMESDDSGRQCVTGSISVEGNEVKEPRYDDSSVDGEETRTCDSAGGSVAPALPSTSRLERNYEEEVGEGVVTESHCLEKPSYFVSTGDNNVDSTSSETVRSASQLLSFHASGSAGMRCREPAAVDGWCDSNYERLPNAESVSENSVTGDESSLEGLGVSSSNVTEFVTNHSPRESFGRVTLTMDALPDNAVSTAMSECSSGISPSTSANTGMPTPVQEHSDHSLEGRPSSTAVTVCLSPCTASCSVLSSITLKSPGQTSPLMESSSHLHSHPSTVTSADGPLSSTTPSSVSLPASAPVPTNTVPVTSSPISSTAEAAPAVKKKVSLLEYRKRLKEKPATSSATETKTTAVTAASSSSSSSSSSSITHHHRLSSTLSQFLASSSLSTSSATSTTHSKSSYSLSSSSSSNGHKKHRMPTLATLPLFKSVEKKEEEKKKSRLKPEKHLSLTDRLRLEFGLDDCDDDPSRKKKDDRKKYRGGRATPPPPPPPLHPPPPLPPGSTLHHHHYHPVTRHNVKDGEESEVASTSGRADESTPPPPPPPPCGSALHSSSSATANGLVASSTHSRAGYQNSHAPLVNGGSGSFYNYQQQQPNISSTSLSTPPPPHGVGGRERHGSGFSAHSGVPGPASSHSAEAAYQTHHQQPSSSSLPSSSHINPPPHLHGWNTNQGSLPSSVAPLLSTNPHHIPPPSIQYDMNRQPPQSQTTVSGNIVPDEHPPPPPPPPPRPHRPNSSSSSSSLSSSSHRHHPHHSVNGKSKTSKAAASSSSSRHSDKRSRY